MDEVQRLVNEAREHVRAVYRLATELLNAGADADRVHARYFAGPSELMGEVEVRALLASAGDPIAVLRLEPLVEQLRALRAEARRELRDQRGGREG